jgi:hypothetical protein
MTTSGTTAFNLDVQEMVEEAFERAGLEMRTGYDLRSARRSINLLTAEWANRGFNLWTVAEYAIPLLTSTPTYTLPSDTIDTLDHVRRSIVNTTQSDIVLRRLGLSSYAAIPNKLTPGQPVQVYVNRQIAPTITVWPVPTNSNDQLVVWYLRRMQDAGAGGTYNADIPFRFIPPFIAGLAYMIALKRPKEVPEPRVERLLGEYTAQWELAASEDRDRTSLRLVPSMR